MPIDSSPELALVCPGCGYSLHAIESDRCPECGMTIDRTTLSVSRLPWSHRGEIGRFAAYWRMNLMAMFRPRAIGQEMNRPVSFADSQRFRQVTVMLGFLPLLAWGVVPLVGDFSLAELKTGSRLGWMLEAIDLATTAFSAWLLLFMMSGSASYFFHPRQLGTIRQNRAVALSYYACAPLAWTFIPAVAFAISVWFDSGPSAAAYDRFAIALALIGGAATLVILVWWWVLSILILRSTIHCALGRAVALALYLPASWFGVAAVAFLIAMTVFYVSLVIMSFR